MSRMRVVTSSVISLIFTLLVCAEASAQQAASIAGVVKDTTGAVLPGVTVEATSPALIEKVRSVVTDGNGVFRIVDLRPGTYDVTFSLAGFNTVKRQGVTLNAGFTAAINADLKVGALEETITVTGSTPLVDTQNVRQQKSATAEVLQSLPTGTLGVSNLAALTPGLTTTAVSNVGGAAGTYNTASVIASTFHGKTGAITQFDGMGVNNMARPGATGVIISPGTLEEWAIETGGGLAESNASNSIAINVVPKEGGNSLKGIFSGLYSNDSLQGDNLTDALRARGLTTVNRVTYIFNADASVGGPIRKDKLWFFTSHRATGNKNQRAGVFFNATQGTPFYTPDPDRPAYRRDLLTADAVRLTWQVTQKSKLNLHAEPQKNCVCLGRGENVAPEASYWWDFWPTGIYQATWSSPVTNRLLFEAGMGAMIFHWPTRPRPEAQGDAITSITNSATGFQYNSQGGSIGLGSYGLKRTADRYTERLSASYVTGSHAFKAGFNLEQGTSFDEAFVNGARSYTFSGMTPTTAVPQSITLYAMPWEERERMKANLGVFGQDRWTLNRLTLNLGVRFEYLNTGVPAQHLDAGPFVPARDFAPVNNVPNWKDLSPRLGASYDVFGNGRTAVRGQIGKYLSSFGAIDLAQIANPVTSSVNLVSRNWNDLRFPVGDPRRGNFVPDCNLANTQENDECGANLNQAFGQTNIRTRYADDVATGFGNRGYLWDFSTELQQQIGHGLSVTGGYYRNWDKNLTVNDNVEVVPSDYTSYCVTAPPDARLPDGGGYRICNLADVSPVKQGQFNTVVSRADKFGNMTRVSDFFAISLSSRFGHGVQFGGGLDTGRTVADRCFVIDSPAQTTFDFNPANPISATTTPTNPSYCRIVTPFKGQTQLKLWGSYPLPLGFSVSGTLQNLSGPAISALYTTNTFNSEIASQLGRNIAACGATVPCLATVTVPLVKPQTMFADRRTQIDLRLTKLVKIGPKLSVDAHVDVYNVTNSSSIISLNNTYGASWQLPTAVLDARFIQFGGLLKF